jgi:hypothetical protein
MVETGKYITLSDFCFLFYVICLLTPDNRHLIWTCDIENLVFGMNLNWPGKQILTFELSHTVC